MARTTKRRKQRLCRRSKRNQRKTRTHKTQKGGTPPTTSKRTSKRRKQGMRRHSKRMRRKPRAYRTQKGDTPPTTSKRTTRKSPHKSDFPRTKDFAKEFDDWSPSQDKITFGRVNHAWQEINHGEIDKLMKSGTHIFHDGNDISYDRAYDLIAKRKKVTNVIFHPNITKIGDRAFKYCENLITVDIPEGVKHIGANAFDDCTNLKKVKFPKSLETVGGEIFLKCVNLREVDFRGTNLVALNYTSNMMPIRDQGEFSGTCGPQVFCSMYEWNEKCVNGYLSPQFMFNCRETQDQNGMTCRYGTEGTIVDIARDFELMDLSNIHRISSCARVHTVYDMRMALAAQVRNCYSLPTHHNNLSFYEKYHLFSTHLKKNDITIT